MNIYDPRRLKKYRERITKLEMALAAQLRFDHPSGCACKGCKNCREILNDTLNGNEKEPVFCKSCGVEVCPNCGHVHFDTPEMICCDKWHRDQT